MKVENIQLVIEGMDRRETEQAKEILAALITAGGISGVRGGKTIIHFDPEGIFQKIQLDYFPWQRRNVA